MADGYIIITGAAGMIGSGVVRHLNTLGHHNLILVDDLDSSDKWKNLLRKNFCQLLSIGELFPFLQGRSSEISAFIHLGACSDTLEKRGDYLMENNYRYSLKLAEYALSHGHRFIYASSAATYGKGELGFHDDPSLIPSLQPLNLYGFSKHVFDLWVLKQGVQDRVVGLKYFNIFGPNENHKGHMASMVYKMVPTIKKEGFLQLFASSDKALFADGEQKRDFLYVKDAVRLTCEFLEHDRGGIFNIGQGLATSWNTLARAVFTAMGKDPCIRYMPMPEELQKQYQNYTCATMGRLLECRQKAGLTSPLYTYSVEEAVREYVQDYLEREERW
ncbi:MAG: ADP-glyceromanno-heptose 6-epimerase [Chlamydiae bacterium]|nr:ADP-glyceromanno-heptose 6-epimerase [Chlamydiota bacterium]